MILLIDKPKWRTSFDIVKKVRSYLPKKTKVGHSWTLDPMATGLLVLWTHKDTKNLADIQSYNKEYIANIDFSVLTDTWDMDYHEFIENYEISLKNNLTWIIKDWNFISSVSIDNIKSKLDSLIPSYSLPLPSFSAKKIWWKKFYDLARKWDLIEKYQEMKIYNYEILNYEFPNLKIKIKVWSWTYIRSIAYWIGNEFNLGWTLSFLQRTRIGDYDLNNSYTIDKINSKFFL